MSFFLGVDVGSSKTHALIADETGVCIGFGRAGAGNHQVVGYDGLVQAIQVSCGQACHAAGINPEQIRGAGFGVSGYDFPSDRQPHLEAISQLGLSCPIEIVNDGENGLLAGTTHGIGVCVAAGSSVNCRGRGPNGETGRIVGNGAMFGEFGGASEIVLRGLQMVNYAWIKRIPPTCLTALYLQAAGADNEIDLMEGLSSGKYELSPELTIQIFNLAAEGDPAANEVIRWAGAELGWLAVSVIRQIGMEADRVEVIQSGSIFEGGALIDRPMRAVVLQAVPLAIITRLDAPPAVGPLLLGMQLAGIDRGHLHGAVIRSARDIASLY
jgi:N-acetylglucosamine kinase-like BadF-type ATPase